MAMGRAGETCSNPACTHNDSRPTLCWRRPKYPTPLPHIPSQVLSILLVNYHDKPRAFTLTGPASAEV